ncbi:HAD family hydrolase [Candidatus Pristimantibacillus sp. PTI5]|uniref:HAD family hydrolase n=1 Tax=Candidatus Pristimantibacillus sp. PTI5 TaxID=3400422 RepID=UPI003B01B8B9
MVKAVFFDLDDTLYDQLQPFLTAVRTAGISGLFRDRLQAEDLFKRLRKHSDRLWEKHASGMMSLEELRIERTTAAFLDIGINLAEQTAVQLQENYEREQKRIKLRNGAETLFGQLESYGIRMGLITNGPVEHQMIKIRSLGLLNWIDLQAVYISDGIGIAKPDPEVFRHVRLQSCFDPEVLVYVGDAWHNDIVPSYQAGWNPVWLNGRKQLPRAEDKDVKYKECRSINEIMPLIHLIQKRDTGCLP